MDAKPLRERYILTLESKQTSAETLDGGNPAELAAQYRPASARMPRLNVFGGCCGADLRHEAAIARALTT